MSKLKSTAGKKARYGNYQSANRYTKNKEKKLLRHLAKFPNDTQAEKATDNIKVYSRKKPNSKIAKWHVVPKKSKAGKAYSVKELARPRPHTVAEYLNGIPVIAEAGKTAMQMAMETAKH